MVPMTDWDLRLIKGDQQRSPVGVPDVAGDHLNAQHFLLTHGHNVKRAPELGRWYLWNGAWWEEDRLDRVLDMAADVIDELRSWVAEAEGPDEFKRRSSHYQASAKAGRREALLSIVGADRDVVVAVDQLDAHPLLLTCRNGTVDLTTGDLIPANRDHLITRGVSIDYDPDAVSELWESFITTTFNGDVDLTGFVRRLLGYCCSGEVREHIIPVATGPGSTSKSTTVGVVTDILGDHAITAPEGLVITHGHEPHPERLAVIRGRRLVVSAELEQRAVLAEGVVKMLSGGDTISAREMYGRRFNFKPSHKVLLVTNHRPRVYGTDTGIWRRLRIVPFERVIATEDQDPTLRRRLVEEHGPAVLAWLVRGAVEWHKDGLGEAEAVAAATERYRSTQDTMGAFLAECTMQVPTTRTKVGDLFEVWRTWCEEAGERPGRKQDFSAALEEHGIVIETYQNARLARGIGILVRSGEVSPGTSSISTSTGTLRTRPNETSPDESFDQVKP
jgi:putative DNA primase/helicase